jgi:poly(beta-D-mannuronate) lyase
MKVVVKKYTYPSIYFPLLLALITITPFRLLAEDYLVHNRGEISSAMNQAQPGDTLTMANGVWQDQNIDFSGSGVEGDSILLRAETPGHVILNGSSRLSIDGEYLKVDGLRFYGGYNESSVIVFEGGSQHCRVTNTQVSEYNPPNPNTRYHWIILKGSHNRLDHCHISGKRHSGVVVHVSLSSSPYGYHLIDHNHFTDIPEGDGNGYETIKIAGGAYSDLTGNVIVENNYFYRCSGEMEIISNKCHNNIYRYNTFVECMGTLTMRQGMNCTVQGNYFFGNDAYGTGGVRITHRGHKIFNNYFQDLDGTGQRSAISLYAGMDHTDYIVDEGGHVRADSITIAHNTIINCESGIYSGSWDDDDPIRLPPKDNIIANNVVTMNDDARCYDADSDYPGIDEYWESNLLSGSNLGDVPDVGYIEDDPELVLIDTWYQISASSPAINNATGEYPFVVDDIDGFVRDELKDIGADELGMGPRGPLSADEVGPSWYGTVDLPVFLTVGIIGDGEVLFDPPGGGYTQGTVVTLTAVPDEGHTFLNWSGDLSGAELTTTITMDTNKQVIAHFLPPVMYSISVWNTSGSASGSVIFSPDTDSYLPGTLVTITAVPAEGYEFDSWGGDLVGSSLNPDTLLMTENKSVMVHFMSETSALNEQGEMPVNYELGYNFPNPFNPTTTIPFTLKESGITSLTIYKLDGTEMLQPVSGYRPAGFHQISIDASQWSSGVYLCVLETPTFNASRKMILLR